MPLYRRSAFQVALLLFCSLGLYIFVWAFWSRRACAAILERKDQPLWKSIALIIPLFNLFLLFDLGQMIQGVKWRTDSSQRDEWLPWLGVSVFVFNILGRLHGEVSDLGLLGYAPIALLQLAFFRAQIALFGEDAVPTRLHWLEWIVVVIGGGFWVFATVGMAISGPPDVSPAEKGWYFASLAVAVAGLAAFWRSSRIATAEGLAMHANPSEHAIAPGAYQV